MLHTPDIHVGVRVLRDSNRLTLHGLEQESANIVTFGKVSGIADRQLGFLPVKELEFHADLLLVFISGGNTPQNLCDFVPGTPRPLHQQPVVEI